MKKNYYDQDKKRIRLNIRKKRQQLTKHFIRQASAVICKHARSQKSFIKAIHIAFYYSHDKEVDPNLLLNDALYSNKQCYLPVLDPSSEKALLFCPYLDGMPLFENQYGIPEPQIKKGNVITLLNLDLVFVPLVAFDLQGNRLGYGMGYYDRTLAYLKTTAEHNRHRPILIGLAYEFQKVDCLKPAPWDIPLDMVITDAQVYRILGGHEA